MNLCKNCGKETQNPKFCSRSCSASFNNKKRQKVQRYCITCGILIGEGTTCRKKYCDECRPNTNIQWSEITLQEIENKQKYQSHSRIRELARRKVKNIPRFSRCSECGYSNHIEICHIKAIKDFDKDANIEQINDLSNLVSLCPNHHWEFDNNILPFNPKWLNE